MKLNSSRDEESDIKITIYNAARSLGWNFRVDRAMQSLNDKPDVFYSVDIEDDTDVVIRYWLEEEVQTNQSKIIFIQKTFHKINEEFTEIGCSSMVDVKDIWRIFKDAREILYHKKRLSIFHPPPT